MSSIANLKQQAAHRAVAFVKSGMVVGLGTGSTTRYALEKLSEFIRSGQLHDIVGIPSSEHTRELALSLGIKLTDFATHPRIDITIDGADEVDDTLNLIKGGGGALLREKIVAQLSRQNIIIVDESKLSLKLGSHWPVPIEVLPFAADAVIPQLQAMNAVIVFRRGEDGKPFCTDQHNWIIDADFGEIADPAALAHTLDAVAGIMAHGLFIGLTNHVIVAGEKGTRIIDGNRRQLPETAGGKSVRLT